MLVAAVRRLPHEEFARLHFMRPRLGLNWTRGCAHSAGAAQLVHAVLASAPCQEEVGTGVIPGGPRQHAGRGSERK